VFRVQLEISLPGQQLVVKPEIDRNHAHEDVYVALRDAFDAATRQVKEYVQRHRNQVKTHATPAS
jgi:ribosome-associated translation inhibitor RaiA